MSSTVNFDHIRRALSAELRKLQESKTLVHHQPEFYSIDKKLKRFEIAAAADDDDVEDDGWETESFKELKRLIGNVDPFNHKSYFPINNKRILYLLDRLAKELSELESMFKEIVYFSTVSNYCGLLEVVNEAAEFAVNCYNQRMGKSLSLDKISHANYIWSYIGHLYFITLDLCDTSCSIRKTFQTSVYFHSCRDEVRDVWNFSLVKVNEFQGQGIENSVFGEEEEEEEEECEDDDGWETESFKNIEKSLHWDVFGDPKEIPLNDPYFDVSPLFRPPLFNEDAKLAVDHYNEKKGGKLKFVKISKANGGWACGTLSNYFTVKTIDTSSGMEKTFCTNIIAPQGNCIPCRVRAFKPEPHKERIKDELIHKKDANIVDEDGGWEDVSFKELIDLMDLDCFNDDRYESFESIWIFGLLAEPLQPIPEFSKFISQKKYEVSFSPVPQRSSLVKVVKKAAKFAVDLYNERKGRNLKHIRVSKANYIPTPFCHFFFLTIVVVDTCSDIKTKITVQTSVYFPFNRRDLRNVWSFKLVKVM